MLENDKFYEKKNKEAEKNKRSWEFQDRDREGYNIKQAFLSQENNSEQRLGGDEEVNKADIWKKVFQAKKQKGTVGSVLIMFKEEKVSWRKKVAKGENAVSLIDTELLQIPNYS